MKNGLDLELQWVGREDRTRYMEYLLMADESEDAIHTYLFEGEMFAILVDGRTKGAVLLTFPEEAIVEIKNISLVTDSRGQGYGKAVIDELFRMYKSKGKTKMVVGTANSSIGNLAFYQKAGFRVTGIKKDFFRNYPEPIFESGIRALDMIIFEKHL